MTKRKLYTEIKDYLDAVEEATRGYSKEDRNTVLGEFHLTTYKWRLEWIMQDLVPDEELNNG